MTANQTISTEKTSTYRNKRNDKKEGLKMKKEATENNEIKPEIGEYWYCNYGSYDSDIAIGKIVGRRNDSYVVKFKWGHKILTDARFSAKWVPSRFWKMLGYK